MKILLVSSFLPYPLYSGGHIRLYNLIKGLSGKHKITLVCEKRDYQTEKDVLEVEKICEKVITVDRRKQWSWQNIAVSGFSINPFLAVGHTNNDMRNKIGELLSNTDFDLIHVETFYVLQNVPQTKIPIVLAEHNIEHLVYERFAKNAPFFIKPFLYVDIAKMKYQEQKAWDRAGKLIAVSSQDKEMMGKRNVEIVSNGVDINKFKVRSEKSEVEGSEKRILFIGDFKWIENRDAVKWILKEIWPEIKSKIKNQKSKLILWIVGRRIPQEIRNLGGENVIFDENAPENTNLIYQKADVLLAPIRVGGGTSFKILEAMASGVPVVTTDLGNSVNAQAGREIIIAENSSDFAKKTIEILTNNKAYIDIANNARKFIEENYTWEKIIKKLEAVYEEAVKND
ncbi:MAG: glycosyltransferase family 4 protein [Candidatus Levybacteria bacterium]|nr:glycosyltransferase family 4 protein [Candidatus Levybacteria bacterium]